MKILIGAGFVIGICTAIGVKLCNVSRVSCIEFAGSRLWSVTDIYCLSATPELYAYKSDELIVKNSSKLNYVFMVFILYNVLKEMCLLYFPYFAHISRLLFQQRHP